MRLGVFGGSFDPIHRGHVEPVLAARDALGLDRVLYLPTADPPHKPGRLVTPAHRRFAMVELALLAHDDLKVSALELTPGRPAYTVETLERLRRERSGDALVLLVGADSFAHLHTWRRWRELAELAELGVMVRPGWGLDHMPEETPAELRALLASPRVTLVEGHPVDLSATEIRRRLAAGLEPPAGALADLVLAYITKYDLYR
ncbi:MAG: nicotinate (nicotinamide) nucleotide adenylyltransferase [Acidobacteria bacterium]|nr:nicotinate (nicotinamide) nucleotide adenylyltransferase [Acidobacteriota bacterium]